MDKLPKIVVICGPTASGKSAAAVGLALAIGGEVVSADSGAVYRYLDIGTAKPTQKERETVSHHLIDVVDPDERYDAMAYRNAADAAIDGIIGRTRVPVVAGGTGLYLKALIFGLFETTGTPREKGEVRESFVGRPTGDLFEELSRVDPPSAAQIGPNDRVRITRALEVFRMTGEPASRLRERHAFRTRRYDALVFGLSVSRPLLYARIDRRVDEMAENGIVQEVKRVLGMGYPPTAPGLSIIGYKEVVEHLSGMTDLETALGLIKKNTRNYAKRQMTWFRKTEGIRWVEHPCGIEGMIGEARTFLAEVSPYRRSFPGGERG
jgi:tRNA dimethylallyltransferase